LLADILSFGGFEHNATVLGLVGYIMLICVASYDDLVTPAWWCGVLTVILVAFGVWEVALDPYVAYTYNRAVLVSEQFIMCTMCCPLFFFCMWYQIYHLRQEIEQRKEAEALARKESQAKADFLAHMSHEIRTPVWFN
jgi:signal transduction histidine kinase